MTYIHLLVRLFPGEHISAFHLYVSDIPIGGELGICVKNRSHPVSQRPAWIQRRLQPRLSTPSFHTFQVLNFMLCGFGI